MTTTKQPTPKQKGNAIHSMLTDKNRLSKQLAQAAVNKAMTGKNIKSLKIKVKFGGKDSDDRPKRRSQSHKSKWGY